MYLIYICTRGIDTHTTGAYVSDLYMLLEVLTLTTGAYVSDLYMY